MPDPDGNGRAFALAIGVNTLFVAIEFIYGFIAHSTALMADAGHNLSDVLGLLLAWGAAVLTRSKPHGRYTYGLRGSTILAALANAVLLLVACGAIAWEAVQRFAEPAPVAGSTVSIIAAIGVAINGFSAWLFMKGAKDDLNVRGAYLHMAADAALSLGVVVSGLVIMSTGWTWIDPAVSLVIVVVIVAGTWSLLRESVQLQYEQAYGEKRRALSAMQARQRTVDVAQRVYDLTVLRYERGLATQLEVSDARLSLLQARTNLAQAISDFYTADAGQVSPPSLGDLAGAAGQAALQAQPAQQQGPTTPAGGGATTGFGQ